MRFFSDLIDAKVLPNGRISISKESLEDLTTVMAVQQEINGRQPNLRIEANAYFTALVKLLYEDKPTDGSLSLDFILKAMAENHTYIVREDNEFIEKQITEADIKSKCRKQEWAIARHRYCYYAKLYSKQTLSSIGGFIGRDHTTIIHAVKNVEGLMRTDTGFREETQRIEKLIRPALIFAEDNIPPEGNCSKGGDHNWVHKHTSWSICTKCNISEIIE
jgi:hypothetical protein